MCFNFCQVKLPEIQKTMMEMSREMMKVMGRKVNERSSCSLPGWDHRGDAG